MEVEIEDDGDSDALLEELVELLADALLELLADTDGPSIG